MAYIGNTPGVSSQRYVDTFTPTTDTTVFTTTSGYALGYADVYLNGQKLIDGIDYTASNGTTVVLTDPAISGDVVEVVAFKPRGLSDGYTKAETDSLINAIPEATPTQVSDQANTSTGYFDLPSGTTAQRPTSLHTGQIRFNSSIGLAEYYDGTNWKAIDAPPVLTGVSPSTYTGESGTAFTISGSGFSTTGVTIRFITQGGSEYVAGSVSNLTASSVIATTPQDFTVADEPLTVKITNSSGLSAELSGAIDCGGTPVWSSPAAGSLGTEYKGTSYSQSFNATDPEGTAVTYAKTSGALPTGTSLNSSTGVLSGTITSTSRSETFNFDITASDTVGNGTVRSFSQTVTGNHLYVPSGVTALAKVVVTSSGISNSGTNSVYQTGTLSTSSGGIMDGTYRVTNYAIGSQYNQVASLGTLATNNYTFVAWYKGTNTYGGAPTWQPSAVIFGDPRGSVYAGGGLHNGYLSVGYNGQNTGSTFVSDNEWHCLVYVWRGNQYIDGYVDGVLEVTVDCISQRSNIYMDYVGEGYHYSNIQSCNDIGGWMVLNGTLSSTQIAQISNGG